MPVQFKRSSKVRFQARLFVFFCRAINSASVGAQRKIGCVFNLQEHDRARVTPARFGLRSDPQIN
jgi:hypothetical protein